MSNAVTTIQIPSERTGMLPMSGAASGRTPAHRRLERLGALYGACPAMRRLFTTIGRLAPTSAAAVILGESGSGKELVARAIHEHSPRREHPFIPVNCGALPANLIESELFGHERGSFTGATRTRRGCFERADRGTLFLDEVADMPIDLQVRLLRVLETGRFSRVGGDEEIAADVRVIAACNLDLDEAVAAGRLREDLMYRLSVIPVAVPPLRERGEDAALLAEMFLDELNREHGARKFLTPESRERIAGYCWPGNVRELRNVVHRSYVMSDEAIEVDVERTRPEVAQPAFARDVGVIVDDGHALTIPVGASLDDAERALILLTLRAVAGSKVKAARVLGISLKTLYNRLQLYRSRDRTTASCTDERQLAAAA